MKTLSKMIIAELDNSETLDNKMSDKIIKIKTTPNEFSYQSVAMVCRLLNK